MKKHPRRRHDLDVEPVERGGRRLWCVRDRARMTTFWFAEPQALLLRALDGRLSAKEAAVRVAARTGASVAELLEVVDAFAEAGLLAGSGAPDPGMAPSRLANFGQLVTRTLGSVTDRLAGLAEAATSDCDRCELRCCSYRIDVAESELEALAEAVSRLRPVLPCLLAADQSDAPAGQRVLAQDAQRRCVLLDDDGRCRVHAAAGLRRKPSVCQLYPAIPVLTPRGARAGVRAGCAWPGRTTDPDAAAGLRELLSDMATSMPRLTVWELPDEVILAGSATVPWAVWDAREDALRKASAAAGGQVGQLLRDTAVALAAEAGVSPSEPDREALDHGLEELALAFVVEGRSQAAEAVEALRRGAKPLTPGPFPAVGVVTAIDALELLRGRTAMASLGRLALRVALVDRDARAVEQPHETAAWWARVLRLARPQEVVDRQPAEFWEAVAATGF